MHKIINLSCYYWNILACGCNDQGSANMSCSSDGICTCKENIAGNKCDICEPGYFPYPDCSSGGKLYAYYRFYC